MHRETAHATRVVSRREYVTNDSDAAAAAASRRGIRGCERASPMRADSILTPDNRTDPPNARALTQRQRQHAPVRYATRSTTERPTAAAGHELLTRLFRDKRRERALFLSPQPVSLSLSIPFGRVAYICVMYGIGAQHQA